MEPHPKWWYILISSVSVNPVGRSGAWLGSHAQEEGFTCRWCVFPVQNCCPSEVLELSLAAELAPPPFWGLTQRGREHAQLFSSFLPFVFRCWPGILSFLTTALGFLASLLCSPSCLVNPCCQGADIRAGLSQAAVHPPTPHPHPRLLPEGCRICSLPNLGFSF